MKRLAVSMLFVFVASSAPIAPAIAALAPTAFSRMYLNSFEESLATGAGVVEHGVPMADVCDAIEYGQAMGMFWRVRRCETKVGQVISTDGVGIVEAALQVRYTQITTDNLDGERTHILSAQTMPSTRFETYPVYNLYDGPNDHDFVFRIFDYFRYADIRMCLLESALSTCDDTDDDDIYGMSADKQVTTEAISYGDAWNGATNRRLTHTYRMTADGRILLVTDTEVDPDAYVMSMLYDETPGYYSEIHDQSRGISYLMRYRTKGGTNKDLSDWAVFQADDGRMPDEANGGRLDMTTVWEVDPNRIGPRNLRMAVQLRGYTTDLASNGDPIRNKNSAVVRSSAAFDIEPDYVQIIDIDEP